jgi:hypothetical protein
MTLECIPWHRSAHQYINPRATNGGEEHPELEGDCPHCGKRPSFTGALGIDPRDVDPAEYGLSERVPSKWVRENSESDEEGNVILGIIKIQPELADDFISRAEYEVEHHHDWEEEDPEIEFDEAGNVIDPDEDGPYEPVMPEEFLEGCGCEEDEASTWTLRSLG